MKNEPSPSYKVAIHNLEADLTHTYRFAWRTSIKLVRIFPVFVTLAAFGFVFLTPAQFRAVELAVSLIAGLHAAIIFAPEDEPALEVILGAPRPLAWLLAERLILLLALHLPVGIFGTLLVAAMNDISFGVALLRWLPPTLFMVGFGVYTALLGRHSNSAALLIVMLFFGAAVGGDVILFHFPDVYPIHPYLMGERPDPLALGGRIAEMYWINRIVVTLIGMVLLGRTFWSIRSEERLLGI